MAVKRLKLEHKMLIICHYKVFGNEKLTEEMKINNDS